MTTKPKEKAKAPWQRLKKKDVQLVCEELKDADVEELRCSPDPVTGLLREAGSVEV